MEHLENCPHEPENTQTPDEPNQSQSGQGLVEYSLLLGLIAMAVVSTLTLLGPPLRGLFQGAANAL